MDRALQAQPPPQHAPVNLLQIGNPIENLGSLERGAQAREPRPLQAPPPLSAALLPPPRAQQAGLGELRRPKAARPGRMLSWRARSWPRVDFVAPDFSRNSVDRKREPSYPCRLHLDWRPRIRAPGAFRGYTAWWLRAQARESGHVEPGLVGAHSPGLSLVSPW